MLRDELDGLGGLVGLRGEEDVAHVAVPSNNVAYFRMLKENYIKIYILFRRNEINLGENFFVAWM